jgi:hypothetical protein
MKDIKVMEYGLWVSYTYTKQNKEISRNSFKLDGESVEQERQWQ